MAHAASLEFGDGRTIRIGPDERDVKRSLISANYDSEAPGGFGPGSLVVPRPDRFDDIDARLLIGARIYEAETNRTLHAGRVVGTPSTGVNEVEITLEGWSKHTEDNKTCRALIIDQDRSHWQLAPSSTRKVALWATSWGIEDGIVDNTDGSTAPAVACQLNSPWGNPQRKICEVGYDAGPGMKVGQVYYNPVGNAQMNFGDANWVFGLQSFTHPDGSGQVSHYDIRANPVAAYRDVDARYPFFQLYYGLAVGGEGYQYQAIMRDLAAVGQHGLPKRGSAAPQGYWASDILPYLLSQFAPLLNYSTDSIEETSFAIPHMAHLEDTTLREMIEPLAVKGGNSQLPMDWGCYGDDGKEFFYKSPGSYGMSWRARRSQASESNDEGPDVALLRNGVKVEWDDGTGTKYSVGPPGSYSDFELAELLDDDPENPANVDGARHWEKVDAGVNSQEGATLIGQIVLANARRQDWRGDVVLTGEAIDSSGVPHHVGAPRAGDSVVVEDDPDTAPRRIVGTSCDGLKNSLAIGAPPDQFDSLLARSGIVLEGQLAT